ncbi:hypothetical protein PILCRDRAFT_17542 [Piloderma croceum F 1598]|uniref:Uncharacterized protein n=1 Tax=Piloderma croceum (strain F 1598) TaxID=765440 RepID=A0A0C3B139_PILCF|nr:hypothetical protein PILCRDRAFT_17542 [Piloderma croceum F 1598]
MSPLPNQDAPCDLFVKTEPQRLGFWFLAQIPPPSCTGLPYRSVTPPMFNS